MPFDVGHIGPRETALLYGEFVVANNSGAKNRDMWCEIGKVINFIESLRPRLFIEGKNRDILLLGGKMID